MKNNPHQVFKKIMIIGRPGGGKSTYAINLQKQLGYPLLHLDKIFFVDHWQQNDYTRFIELQQQFIKQPTWIIDGNSSKSYEIRYSVADICIYFNTPKWLCYWRVFKRLFYKHPEIDDRAQNCHETVRLSLLKYMWGFENHVKPTLEHLRRTYPEMQID